MGLGKDNNFLSVEEADVDNDSCRMSNMSDGGAIHNMNKLTL